MKKGTAARKRGLDLGSPISIAEGKLVQIEGPGIDGSGIMSRVADKIYIDMIDDNGAPSGVEVSFEVGVHAFHVVQISPELIQINILNNA